MKREKAVDFLTSPLIALLEQLQTGSCIFDCDSYNLGMLVKNLNTINMYPVPQKPFHGVTLYEISNMIRTKMKPSDASLLDLHRNVRLSRPCPQESTRWDLLDKLNSHNLQDLKLKG